MEQYALIGYPLGHSLSPEIHRRLFALEGIAGDYRLDAFPPEAFQARAPQLKRYAAFNITIPYKRAILPYLDALEESAALYGAVNSVRREPDGRWTGCNTDCGGFLRTMDIHGVALNGSVCVLGAGGVGRMFAIECARQGARVTVAVRDSGREKAAALAAEISEKLGTRIAIAPIAALCGPFDLLINATPVGMFPQVEACPVEKSFLETVETVFDCIYNPSETLLLRWAAAAGKRAVGGMEMLVWQAAIAHEHWHGSRFTAEQCRSIADDMHTLLRKREAEHA